MYNNRKYNPFFSSVIQRLPNYVLDLLAARPFLTASFKVAVLLLVFMSLEWFVFRLTSLSHDSYAQPSLLTALFNRAGIISQIIVAFLFIIGMRYGSIWTKWQTLEQGRTIRYFVVFVGCLIAWPLSTFAYNFYFDQGHYIERFAMIFLLVLIWWRPVFIFPFVVIALATLFQLKQLEMGGSILAHKLQLLHVLNLFAAAFFVHAVSGYRKMDTFVFVCCCLVASAYWLPAYAKLQLGWLGYGQLYYGTLAAYSHGWLGFLKPEQIVAIAQSINWLDGLMRITVLAIEGGCLFFMLRRRLSVVLLIGVIIFHIGVFMLIGFLFWTWILLDLALMLMLIKDRTAQHWPIYNKHYLFLSFILIGLGAYWAKPPALAWIDTRLAYTFQIEAITEQGEKFILEPEFFAPYDDIFTMAAFSYLVKERNSLVGPYGVTKDPEIASALMHSLTAEQIIELEKTTGRNNYHAKRAKLFYTFITRFVVNHNLHADSVLNLHWLSPPRQFWSFTTSKYNPVQGPIKQLIVYEVTSLYDDVALKIIRRNELMRLDMADYET